MKRVLKWVLIPIAVVVAIPLLLLVLLLLCFPVKYRIFANIHETNDIKANISYLFGLIRFKYTKVGEEQTTNLRILFLQFRDRVTEKNIVKQDKKTRGIFSYLQENIEKEAIGKDSPAKKTQSGLKDILTFGSIKTIIKDSFKTVKKLLVALRPKFIDIEGEFGRADPADTALLYGGYEAVAHMLGVRENVRLQPVFGNEAEVLRLRVDAWGRVNFLRLIFPMAGLLLSKPIRNIILKGASE